MKDTEVVKHSTEHLLQELKQSLEVNYFPTIKHQLQEEQGRMLEILKAVNFFYAKESSLLSGHLEQSEYKIRIAWLW